MKTAMVFVVLAASITLLSGCSPSVEAVQDFKEGEIRTSNVGEAMITWGFNETNFLAGGKHYYQEHRSELVFNGTDGATIFIGYREFTSDLAGAGVSDELKYPLHTKTITCKERELEVLEVTGSSIKFKVLK
jgi:hypothetical protein